jgi:O-antigen ligase
MNRRDTLFLVFFSLFFLSFFHRSLAIVNYIAAGALVLLAFADSSWKQKKELLRERKYIWFMLAFAGMLIISFLLSDNRPDGIQNLVRRIPLFVFPLSIGLVVFDRKFRDKILLGMAIIVAVACLASLGWAIHLYSQDHNTAFLYNDALTSFIGQQSIYTSLFVNISIYVFVYFILYYRLSKLRKLMLTAGIIFLFIISYLLASRNMMLMLYASVFLFSIYIVFKRKKYIEGISLLAGILVCGAVIFIFFPKTINRFKELTFTHFDFEHIGQESHYNMAVDSSQWNGANFRLAAWQCGWEVIKKNPVTGTGLGDKKDELFKIYEEKKFHFAINTRKNVHNNYLDILLATGFTGLLLFFTGWLLLPFIRLVRVRDGLGIMILSTFALAMLTENYFDRSIGVALFGFFVPFLLTAGSKWKGF